MLALRLSAELLIMIGIGFAVWRLGFVDKKFDTSLTAFILNISLPCMIISSFDAPFSEQELKNCFILLGVSVIILALSFAVGQGCFKLCGGGYSGRILRFGTIFTNFSFVGMPIVEQLYGKTGLLYFVVFLVPIRMVYYSAAKPLLSPPGVVFARESLWQRVMGWFSPPVVAVFIGLLLYITGLRLPGIIDDVVESVGRICSPMGMILCGISLGKHRLRELMRVKYMLMPLVRNLLMPLLTIGVLLLLPIEPLLSKVIVIFAALPVASLTAAFTLQYDPEPEAHLESAGAVLSSVIACALTMPLWVQLSDTLFV